MKRGISVHHQLLGRIYCKLETTITRYLWLNGYIIQLNCPPSVIKRSYTSKRPDAGRRVTITITKRKKKNQATVTRFILEDHGRTTVYGHCCWFLTYTVVEWSRSLLVFVNEYCTLDVSFGCVNVTGKSRTTEKGQHGRQQPDGQYDCADEPGDRKWLLSASDDRDSRPVGATNELILESGSLPDGVDWEKLLAFIDTNMSETVMKNSEKQYQSLKTLMRRKLTIYVLRKSGVWLMQACWNTLAHGETATAITS
ncbi:conserved hypothetical protein [Trichinella spiralis]|uniref:hypothetical protein n=1 Tax=Trichinella spiralis TaxID=6334 RepID=UPI0001EFE911|nr:conserved hypothetical protein [Trichinella spiralis]